MTHEKWRFELLTFSALTAPEFPAFLLKQIYFEIWKTFFYKLRSGEVVQVFVYNCCLFNTIKNSINPFSINTKCIWELRSRPRSRTQSQVPKSKPVYEIYLSFGRRSKKVDPRHPQKTAQMRHGSIHLVIFKTNFLNEFFKRIF